VLIICAPLELALELLYQPADRADRCADDLLDGCILALIFVPAFLLLRRGRGGTAAAH
jgi:hypothetical protein